MSIFKSTFKPEIKTQLEKRQEAIVGRTPTAIQYLNARNAWIKMSSSVNVNGSNDLAKKYILQGGVLSEGKLRSGVGATNEAYSTVSSNGTPHRLGIRPMPGITSIDIKSKSAYGSLREVEVKFNAWDIRQLEDLELLYMRPGYTVLIEWGWLPYLDNNGALQNNIDFTKNDIINKKPTKEELFKNIYDTAVKTYGGNYDGMFGYVKNYGWSARSDGGYDCSVSVISIGEVLESLTVNYAPLNNMNQITTGGGLLMGDGDSKELQEAYSQNILAGLFYEIWKIGSKVADGETSIIEDKKKNSSYNIFRKQINIHGGDGDSSKTGTVGSSDEQVYITLESLCDLMNNYVIVTDSNSKKSYVRCSVFEREYEYEPFNPNSSTGEGGYLLSLAHPVQISMDPTVCLIKASLWTSGKLPKASVVKGLTSPPNNPTSEEKKKLEEAEKKGEENQAKAIGAKDNIGFLKKLKPYFYKDNYNEEMGIIGNIYVNVNYLYRLALNNNLESRDTKEKKDINLYDYLKQILSDVSSAIGNVNNFDIHVDPIDNVIRIIDINYVEVEKNRDNVYKNLFLLEMHNAKSTVRSYKLESQIFPDQSSIIAIGAQAGGGAMATDNNTMLDFNKGLEDRIITKKVDPLTDPNRTTAENAISQLNNLASVFDIFYGFFNRLGSTTFLGIEIEDSDYNTEKSDQYKNSLRDLISFYKNLTKSDIKNRSIIPTKLSVTMDGIGGLVIGQMFKISEDLLPKGYKGEGYGSKLGYIVTSIGHSVANNDWTTNIDAQTVILSNPTGEDLTFPDVIEGEGNEKTKKAIEDKKTGSQNENKKETVKDNGSKDTSKPRKTAKCDKLIKNITQANAPGVNISDVTPWSTVKSLYPIVNGPINISAVGTPYDSGTDFAYKMKSVKVYERPNRKIDHVVLHYTAGGRHSDPTNCYKGTWEGRDASSDFVVSGNGRIAGFKNFKNLTSWHYGRSCTWGPSINNSSIGIEIESFGYLSYCQSSNKFLNAYNGEMDIKEVCLTPTYRGLNMWHALSKIQISAVANLIIALYNSGAISNKTKFIQGVKSTNRYGILFPERGLTTIPPPGIITHGTGRQDKIDTFPQKNLLEMLDDLPTLIQSNTKTSINWVTSI